MPYSPATAGGPGEVDDTTVEIARIEPTPNLFAELNQPTR